MRRLVTLAVVLTTLLAAAPAHAAGAMEATFQDDSNLIYADRARVRDTLDRLQALGVDRLRVTVLWKNIAPFPTSRERPLFDATNPSSYPRDAWNNYDRVIQEARARGLAVNLNVTGPAPLWATKPAPREDIKETYEPNAVEFGRFMRAVATRYSGNYPDGPYVAPENRLPRVDYWTIWNEPNHSGWLTPQWVPIPGTKRWVERAPSLYRELLDWSYSALVAAGHGSSTILIGETAPGGTRVRGIKQRLDTLVFIRGLYCLDSKLRHLKGTKAAQLGCGDRSKFREAHPVLFNATGWAHHPYDLLQAPSARPRDPDHVTIGVLGRLTKTLDAAVRRHGVRRRMPIYLTEYGYQTEPDPVIGRLVSLSEQATWLNQAEYIAWRHPRVRTLAQFLLYDDATPPLTLSFQSGLLTAGGASKPALAAYRLPIWVPTRRGSTTTVWGRLRPAATGPATGKIEVARGRRGRFRAVKSVTTTDAKHYFRTRVRARRGDRVRIVFNGARSRTVAIR